MLSVAKNRAELSMNLDGYYKNPIMESWTYIAVGMDDLKIADLQMYEEISRKQSMLLPEMEERIEDIIRTSKKLDLDCSIVRSCIEAFLQKFPLALRNQVGWDDVNFIFLYILTKMLKPKAIIETGCNVGFSSTFIALAIKENNNACNFYTMDPYLEYSWSSLSFVEHNYKKKQKINYDKLVGKCGPLSIVPEDLRNYISFEEGRSEDILQKFLRENSEIDIFFHDSDHSYKNMIWEWASVLPYLKNGGYILTHDVMLNSAFREMFGKSGGLVIKEGIGIFKKTNVSSTRIIEEQWWSPSNNSCINDSEFQSKKIVLNSSPKEIIIQLTNHCNFHCTICLGRKNNEKLDFDRFYQQIEGRIPRYISQAERIIFECCEGLFRSCEIEKMIKWRINCFELSFPEIEKVYYTNGLDLTPEVCDFIVQPRGILSRRYKVKNTINILLSSSNNYLHKILTGSDSFYKILGRIHYLIKLKRDSNNPSVHLNINLVFMASTLNIEDLPDFVRLASNLRIDKVICRYNRIYSPAQKHLSCFIKQEIVNEMLDKAEELAKKLNIELKLPPRFNQRAYSQLSPCPKAWSQIILDTEGNILSCNSFEDCSERLEEKNFMVIWNGAYYQNLRKSLIEGTASCFKHCLYANPAAVNDSCSHLIYSRGPK